MTATLGRPAPGPTPAPPPLDQPAPAPSGADVPAGVRHARLGLTLATEVLVVALSLAAVAGFVRLFDGASFLVPLGITALASHALAASLRRAGVGVGAASLLSAGGMVLVISWLLLGETTAYGVPTAASWEAAGLHLRDAWALFGEVRAPVPPETGFLLASAVAFWFAAMLTDTAAFRFGTALEAAIPPATLFGFAAALGAPRHRTAVTALFLAVLLAYVLCHRARRQVDAPSWLAAGAGSGTAPLLATGAVLAAVAVAAAVVLGPRIPGADDAALVPWRQSDRPSPAARVTVSPLVDIRSRLVNQSHVEVFTVRATERAYWRLTALETFDGRIWSSTGSYRPAAGPLPVPQAGPGEVESIQEFSILSLASIWLPAAFRPSVIDGPDGVRFDPESGSLLTEEETSDGLEYRVRSVLPLPDPAQLDGPAVPQPAGALDRYLDLPADLSVRVRQLAAEVTAGATTPYEQARALQDFLRSDLFAYDLEVPAGHSVDHLEAFLFDVRRGYCEQFAGAYAAMARAVGLPARVAVGFTPGEPDDDGVFVVRGLNAHAWPEVHLPGAGWVAFEPTPGRGIPGAEAYTGVTEQQASVDDPTTATTVPPIDEGADGPGPDAPPPPDPDLPELDVDTGDAAAPPPAGDGPGPAGRAALALAGLLAIAVAWPATLAVAREVRRRRRREAARTPAERVRLAWVEVTEALARRGVARRPAETHLELAARAARRVGVVESMTRLAALAAWADYAAEGPGAADADAAVALRDEVVRHVHAQLGWAERVRWAIDPRPLLPEQRARVVVSGA